MKTYDMPVSPRRIIGEEPAGLLRLALRLDAAASGAMGLLALVAGPVFDALLGVPRAVSWPVGLFLVAFATVLWVTASRPSVSRPIVWAVIVLNALWVVASAAVVAFGWLPLTGLGIAFDLVQAVAVALFARLQTLGLRRARSVAAAGGAL